MPRKFLTVFFAVGLIVLGIQASVFGQAEYPDRLVMTTYYPSPYGVYRVLRLLPQTAEPPCAAAHIGTMYYNESEKKVYFCDGQDWISTGADDAWELAYDGLHYIVRTPFDAGIERVLISDNTLPGATADRMPRTALDIVGPSFSMAAPGFKDPVWYRIDYMLGDYTDGVIPKECDPMPAMIPSVYDNPCAHSCWTGEIFWGNCHPNPTPPSDDFYYDTCILYLCVEGDGPGGIDDHWHRLEMEHHFPTPP